MSEMIELSSTHPCYEAVASEEAFVYPPLLIFPSKYASVRVHLLTPGGTMGTHLSIDDTERLYFEVISLAHTNVIHPIQRSPEVTRYVTWEPHTSVQDTETFINQRIAEEYDFPRMAWTFVILTHHRRAAIGVCSIKVHRRHPHIGTLGCILAPEVWSQGYGSETVNALIKFGFTKIDLHRIQATCDVDNKASRRLMERVGMKYEGRLVHNRRIRDEWHDSFLFAIINPNHKEER